MRFGDQVQFQYDRGVEYGTVIGESPKVKGHWLVVNGEGRYSISEDNLQVLQAISDSVN